MLRAEPKVAADFLDVRVDVVPVDDGGTAGGGKEACQYGHGGGLSGPVVPQQGHDLVGKGRESWRERDM